MRSYNRLEWRFDLAWPNLPVKEVGCIDTDVDIPELGAGAQKQKLRDILKTDYSRVQIQVTVIAVR